MPAGGVLGSGGRARLCAKTATQQEAETPHGAAASCAVRALLPASLPACPNLEAARTCRCRVPLALSL